MSYIDEGFKGHAMKVEACRMLEMSRAMKPGMDRQKMEDEAWNLFNKGEALINSYRTEYEAVYCSK